MNVRYRALALSDLEQIYSYLAPRSPSGARLVLRAIHDAIEQIALYPHSAVKTSISGVRVRVIGRYRYKIFYAVAKDGFIEIIHVRHTARRPWRGAES
jgi:plasmid stabilization system protein ParE